MSDRKPVRYHASTLTIETLDLRATTADTAQLADLIQSTFLLSLDGRLSLGTRSTFYALGVRLRTQLRELLVHVFEAGTANLVEANRRIDEVNAELKRAVQDIGDAADLIENLGALAGSIDKLLGIVGVFV